MRSMTGFGKGEYQCPDGVSYTAEISSVNRKQLEIRFSMPSDCTRFEVELRKLLSSAISRGAVSLRITRTGGSSEGAGVVNLQYLESLARACWQVRRRLGLPEVIDVESLVTVPGVIGAPVPADETVVQEAVTGAVRAALQNFLAMRDAEGAALLEDLRSRMQTLQNLVEEIRPYAASITASIREKLMEKLEAENLGSRDDERLNRELLFYADRSDVTEELTRLASHFAQMEDFFNRSADEPAGRSMDFLVQEMFREITTLGNKAGTGEVSRRVVAFKAELEKFREQIQNVE